MVPAPENENLRPSLPESSLADVLVGPRSEVPSQVSPSVAPYIQPVSPPPAVAVDDQGQTVLQPVSQAVTITLPMDEAEALDAEKHSSPTQGVFWLAKWCEYMLKKAASLGIKVLYLASNNKN